MRRALENIKAGLRDLRRVGGQLLLVTVATRLAVTFLLLPLLAGALRLIMAMRGKSALSDAEIANFFASPLGISTLVVVGGFWVGAAFVEQAALMTVGYAAVEGRRVGWFSALRYVGSKIPVILPLGSHLLGRALLIAAPFLGLAAILAFSLLGEHDINYYLFHRPAGFYWVGGAVVLLLAVMAFLLARKAVSWTLALPAVLFENLGATAAIKDSIADSKGRRGELACMLLGWLAFGAVTSLAVTLLTGFIGRSVVGLGGNSLGWVAFTIGSVGIITLLLNFLVSFVAAALFALVSVRIYRQCSGPGALAPLPAETRLDSDRKIRIQRKTLLLGVAAAMGLAVVATHFVLSKIKTRDEVLVIAHRGSAATAPENTMAAVRDAVAAGADIVEIDVQETADGEVVVFHDSDFMKIADDPLKIWNATRADLDRIDIGSWFDPEFASERVPTLAEVLAECKGRAKVDIELKYYGHDVDLEQKVIDIVEAQGMADQVVVMSLKSDKVAKFKAMRPDWTYGLLTSFQLGDISKFDVDFLGVNMHSAKRRFIARSQAAGFDFYVWTVNDAFGISALISRGADGIITDKPALARQVLEMRAGLSPVERLLIGIGAEVGTLGKLK